MKRKRMKLEDIRRRTRGLALLSVGMAVTYLLMMIQGVSAATPGFIVVALLLTQLFIIAGSLLSLRALRLGAFVTLFSALMVAYMFGTAMAQYVPLGTAVLGALVYSLPHLMLGIAQGHLSLRGGSAAPPDTRDGSRLALQEDEADDPAEAEARLAQRGRLLRTSLTAATG